MASRTEIRKAVQEIAENNGYLDPDFLASLPEDIRPRIERATRGPCRMAAFAIRTLSTQVYGSSARFIFELLQNADDNRFMKARAADKAPYISIQRYPGRIVVECNEDGFTLRDLHGICSVGQSTKSKSYGYIGAKGIGFKSVFMVASKVYVQSGDFSFYFETTDRDDDLGMITPIWQEPEEVLPSPLTRMTLHLRQGGSPSAINHMHSTIDEQLTEIQHTCLLFLRNLRQINIIFHNSQDAVIDARELRIASSLGHNISLETVRQSENGSKSVDSNNYYLSRHTAHFLPERESRESLDTSHMEIADLNSNSSIAGNAVNSFDLRGRGTMDTTFQANRESEGGLFGHTCAYQSISMMPSFWDQSFEELRLQDYILDRPATSEIVLAFPTTEEGEPREVKQEIFSFLPVRRSSYKFIIQADFDTSAGREDIVATSRRNLALLDHIAAGFVEAMTEFRKHSTLQWTWPRYLPSSSDSFDKLWTGLNDKIRERLSQTAVVRARKSSGLRLISSVVMLPDDFVDEHGQPLLGDGQGDRTQSPFLAARYPKSVTNILKAFGLRLLSHDMIATMLRDDLGRGNSRMKSPITSEKWHSAFARSILKDNSGQYLGVPLLPILHWKATSGRSRAWTSALCKNLLLPTSSGMPVPQGIDISVLNPVATANEDRKELFIKLGAREPSVDFVRARIFSAHRSDQGPLTRPSDMRESKAQLHFVYGSQPNPSWAPPTSTRKDLERMWVYTNEGTSMRPHAEDVYMPSNLPYGPQALLTPTSHAPGLNVAFLHEDYLEETPPTPDRAHPSWQTWLVESLAVKQRLEVSSSDGTDLSPAWQYVAKYRPDKLLGLLESSWKLEGSRISSRPELMQRLLGTEAKKLCTSNVSSCRLDQTYLPLPELLSIRQQFMRHNEPFPFLDLGASPWSEEMSRKWRFLCMQGHDRGVGSSDNFGFFFDILKWIRQADLRTSLDSSLLGLYRNIDARIAADVTGRARERARLNFTMGDFILIPPHNGHRSRWARCYECRWEAPALLVTKKPLGHLYTSSLNAEEADDISRFFTRTLQIPACSAEDVLIELRHLRDDHDEDFDRIMGLYKYLCEMVPRRDDILKTAFTTEPLIYVVSRHEGNWHTKSQCLWSSTTDIKGKVVMDVDYEDLKDFFVHRLGVQQLSLQMVYDELMQSSNNKTSEESKATIRVFNAMLLTEDEPMCHRPLLKAPIFPVIAPDGSKCLLSGTAEFAIPDRDYLFKQFDGQIKLLDYTVEEVRHLQPFFRYARLGNRCLSNAVRHFTCVPPGSNSQDIMVANRDIKQKAHALLRIAATFNSPRYQDDASALYALLQNAKVVETDGLSLQLSISQDGREHTVSQAAGDLHIEERASGLTIYVPTNKKAQEVTFSSPLPKRLAEWLMRDPTTNQVHRIDEALMTALTTLLAIDRSVIEVVLDHQGIIQIPIANTDPEPDGETLVEAVSDYASRASTSTDHTPSSSMAATPDDSVSVADSDATTTTVTYQAASRAASTAPRVSTTMSGQNDAAFPLRSWDDSIESSYRTLLNKVVAAAREANFPSERTFDMSRLNAALPGSSQVISFNGLDESTFGASYRSSNRLDRDRRIGAAGELYAFELLSKLDPNLPFWSVANWPSSIRHYVRAHEDYAALPLWSGRETADLVYRDNSSVLTRHLIDKGYLDAEDWEGMRPTYYLEVKTTTGPCHTPFFMSEHQYKRMQHIHDQRASRAEVYVILRVYEIDSQEIGMRVYLDPEQLRLDEQLGFTGETWSIVPR